MAGIGSIVKYLIAIAVLVLLGFWLFYPGSGAFEKIKGITDALKGVGEVEGIEAEKPSIPENHNQQILKLKDTIDKMLNSQKKNCFANYGGFSDLGEEGTTIRINYDSQKDESKITVLGGAGGKQILTDFIFTIPKMRPCVIAGNERVVKNFGDSFLNKKSWPDKNIILNHYYSVNALEIMYHSSFKDADGNSIRVPEFDSNTVNDEGNNLLDAGILYTPDNKNICFFPTVWGDWDCDGSDEEGLDDDCLGEDPVEDISIPQQLKEGKLIFCDG